MARIRTIKPEFWQDEKLAPLDPLTRLVFLGLISMADDGGRVNDNVKIIDAFIFPETQDTCGNALGILTELGRLRRGVTSSGQRVIQVVNWRHQRIDRPNLAGALPPISGDTPELPSGILTIPPRRASLSKRTKDAVWSAAHSRCQNCGVECLREKRDKYDSRPTLGEIDHVQAVRDGGSDDISNLQLLCLKCNRKKAGDGLSARNRGILVDYSTESSGTISVPTINDLRSTTNDQRSSAARAAEAWTADFALAWAAYPKRPNNSRGKASKAYMARRREGVSAEAIHAGVVAYAAYVQAIGQPPHFVKLASTFFGPDEHWLTDYAVPDSDPLAGAPPEVRACILPNGKVRLWEDLPDGETRPTAAMQWLAGRDASGKKVA